MRRKLLSILLGLGMLFVLGTNSQADFRFTFNFSEDKVSFSKDGKLPLYPGGFFANPEGEPRLPVVARTLVLPPGTRVVSASAEYTRVLIKQNWEPSLSQGVMTTNGEYIAYNASEEIVCRDGQLGGYHLCSLLIRPFFYDPLQKALFFNKKVDIFLETDDLQDFAPAVSPVPSVQQRLRRFLEETVSNPQDIENFAPDIPAIVMGVSSALWGAPEFIIITTEEFAPALSSFAEFKSITGRSCRIVTLSQIKATQPGTDTPEKIRNFIREAYIAWGTEYFLIAGDISHIPARFVNVHAICYPHFKFFSDFYYRTLDGTWDSDSDGEFGDEMTDDQYAEVIIGRIPFRTVEEIAPVVNKIIAYETGDILYGGNGIMAASGVLSSLDVGNNCAERTDNILHQIYMDGERLRLYGRADSCGGDAELTSESFLEAVEGGHLVVNHIDHSSFNLLGTGTLTGGGSVSSDELFTAHCSLHPIVVSLGCEANNMEHFSPGAALVLNPDGAVAFIGGNTDMFVQHIAADSILLIDICNDDTPIGDALWRLDNLWAFDMHLTSAFSLTGDPTIRRFSTERRKLNISLLPEDMLPGEDSISVHITDDTGEDVSGAYVRIFGNGEELSYGVTEGNGRFYTTFNLPSGRLSVGAYGNGVFPATIERQIPTSTADVQITDISFIDRGGDRDGIPDPYEVIRFDVTVENTISEPSESLTLSLSASDNAEMIDSVEQLLPLAPMERRTLTNAFSIRIPATIGDRDMVTVRASLTGYETAFSRELNLVCGSPAPVIFDLVRDTTSGESSEYISFAILNSGGDRLDSASASIEPIGGYFSIASGSVYIGDVAEGEIVRLDSAFTVERLSEYPPNAPAFLLTITDARGLSWEKRVDLTPPSSAITVSRDNLYNRLVVRWESSPPDDFLGYLVFRRAEGDSEYSLLAGHPTVLNCYIDNTPDNEVLYEYRIAMLDSSGNTIYSDAQEVPSFLGAQTGFPVGISGKVIGSPAVFDIDGDGNNEIITGTLDDKVYIFNGDGTAFSASPFAEFPSGARPVGIWASPAVADLTGDGEPEILIVSGTPSCGVYLISPSGSILLHKAVGKMFIGTPAVFDLNGDGISEIIVASTDRQVYIWSATGEGFTTTDGFFAGCDRDDEGYLISSPVVGDIDGDGEPEIILAGGRNSSTGKGHLYVWDKFGNPKPGFPVELENIPNSTPLLADLDTDPTTLEIVVADNSRWVYRINHSGEIYVWGQVGRWSEYGLNSFSAADLTGDGEMEIVADAINRIYIWHPDGTPFPGSPLVKPFSSSNTYYPVLADIDSDSRKEIIVGSDDGYIYAFNTDGSLCDFFPVKSGVTNSQLTVDDVDGDGKLEIIAGSWDDSLFIWRMAGSTVSSDNNLTFKGNYKRTGSYGDELAVSIGKQEDTTPIFEITGCYPNPFNSQATIRFTADRNSLYSFELYNILGEKLESRKLGKLAEGEHSIQIDGDKLPSGVYLYEIKRENDSRPGKLTLIR